MAFQVRNSDVGTTFRLTVVDSTGAAVNISAADTLYMYFRKPSSNVIRRTASLTAGGTDGKFEYVTISGDINEVGDWNLQGEVIDTGVYDFRTSMTTFTVQEALVANTVVRPATVSVVTRVPAPVVA